MKVKLAHLGAARMLGMRTQWMSIREPTSAGADGLARARRAFPGPVSATDQPVASIAARGPRPVLRGAALALLGAGGATLTPLLHAPVFGGPPAAHGDVDDSELRSLGIAPLSAGATTGKRMAASSTVQALERVPPRPRWATAKLARQVAQPARAGSIIRVRGRVRDGLFEALRAAQVSAAASGSFVRLFSGKLNLVRDVGPDDHFDLVLAGATAPSGDHDGALLYAAIDRAGASDVRLMKWNLGGRADGIDTAAAERRATSMVWPVSGRISSGFGLRYHPILHFARMHRGVDFAARWGQPIVAATDGVVTRAGWAGGYGKQVRINHSGGLATSYSHLARLAVAPGAMVRAGQLLGYVGSTGLSTGPHLHYEVYRGGVAINPMSARFAASAPLDRAELERFRARLGDYMRLAVQVPRA